MPTDLPWMDARRRLLALRRSDGAWSYRLRSTLAVEPTALSSLALLATDPEPASSLARTIPLGGGRWIAEQTRRGDGSTAVVASTEANTPGWTTPFAILLWNALGGFVVERQAAVAFVLGLKGKVVEPGPNDPIGHDQSLVGWPWISGTHSWVEPTAISLLALAPSVPTTHPRMADGVRVLLDRAIATGGWNLGNPSVFGKTLRSLPGPTGLALLALARVARDSAPASIIQPALAYLAGVVDETFAPTSLGWATLGLRAWNAPVSSVARERMATATARAIDRDAPAGELAMLLLAGGDHSLAVLGFPPVESESAR